MTDYEHWALEYKKSADELRMKIDLMEYRAGKVEKSFQTGCKFGWKWYNKIKGYSFKESS